MTSHENIAREFSQGNVSKGSRMFSERDYQGNLKLYSYGPHFILACILKESGHFLLNGDKYSVSTSKHQSITRHHCQPNIILPFSALQRAGIRPETFESLIVIDRTSDQTREIPYTDPKTGEPKTRTEHLLGACVFKFGKKYLLSGIDTDAKSWGQGYFLVELPRPVNSVIEAYESLKPKDLKPEDQPKRQGEYFFIPQTVTTKELKKMNPHSHKIFEWVNSRPYRLDEYDLSNLDNMVSQLEVTNTPLESHYYPDETDETRDKVIIRYRTVKDHAKGVLMKNKNLAIIIGGNDSGNPHITRDVFITSKNEVYARGTVKHRQHKRLNLGETWHKVLINQAKASFSSGGNVD